jgi:hypothetical protein
MTDIASLQLKIDTTQARSASKDLNDLSKAGNEAEKSTENVGKSFAAAAMPIAAASVALGSAYLVIKNSVLVANEYQNSLKGLASVARFAGEDIGSTLTKANEIAADGILNTTEAATALKNLLAKGFSTDEAVVMIGRFKDAAAFGRQSSLEFGQAVVSATEGIKNENSMLVDNAGVTKNVAKMVEDYAKSIDKTVNGLSEAEKRQAIYNGLMQETEAQVGNAALASAGLTGQQAILSKSINDTAVSIGQEFMPAATAIVKLLGDGMSGLNNNVIKPFLFLFNNVGITIGEVAMKAGAFFDLMSSPKALLKDPQGALKTFQTQIDAFGQTADQMRQEVFDRLEGKVNVNIGTDTGKRRVAEAVKIDPKIAAKAMKQAIDAEQSYMKSVGDTTQSLIDKAAQETIELENLGKTASQIAALEIARIDNQLAMKKEEAARLEGSKAKEDELFLIEQQIKALETLKDVQGKKGAMKDMIEDQKRYAELSKNAYENMAQGIASSISKSILYGKNLQESLVNVAYSVADAFLTAFLQIEIQKLLIGKTAQTSYASTMALEAEATVAQAGLNSFASTAAIPIVGPELAPAAAAAAMAAAQGMAATVIAASSATVASARNGFDIPSGVNPITQLHEKEMVLPAPQAQVIRDMAKSGGGGAQIIDNTTINIDSRSDRMQVMKDVQRMIENGHARLLDRMSRKGQIS